MTQSLWRRLPASLACALGLFASASDLRAQAAAQTSAPQAGAAAPAPAPGQATLPAAAAPAPAPEPAAASRHEPALAEAIGQARLQAAALMAKHRMPGFSVAVVRNGTVVWSEGFGVADVEQGVPVTPVTRFRIGSVSKMLTAAAVGRLVEEGKLDLDAPVQRYVPGFPKKPWPVTTRQLAGHIAGIRHYGAETNGLLKSSPHFDSVTQSLEIFQDDPLVFEPGTKYAYSSYGWSLVAAVVESVSKEDFLTYMQRTVFDPLGLLRTGPDQVLEIVPNRTRYYRRDKVGMLRHEAYVDNSYKWAGGGFLSTAEDLARFGSAHLRPGFLKAETLTLLFTPQTLRSGKETNVGIGWRSGTDEKGRRVRHHGGAVEGGRAMLMLYPDSQVVVAMIANMMVNFGEADAQRLADLFIR